MKKLLYIFLSVSIIFSACKKEEEEPANTNNNNSGNNTVVNNDPSNLIGEWHSACTVSNQFGTGEYYHKIIFFSNGDSFHRFYTGGSYPEYNCSFETPDAGYINFNDCQHSPYTNYFTYTIIGDELRLYELNGGLFDMYYISGSDLQFDTEACFVYIKQ